jgi:hypothetical protein
MTTDFDDGIEINSYRLGTVKLNLFPELNHARPL